MALFPPAAPQHEPDRDFCHTVFRRQMCDFLHGPAALEMHTYRPDLRPSPPPVGVSDSARAAPSPGGQSTPHRASSHGHDRPAARAGANEHPQGHPHTHANSQVRAQPLDARACGPSPVHASTACATPTQGPVSPRDDLSRAPSTSRPRSHARANTVRAATPPVNTNASVHAPMLSSAKPKITLIQCHPQNAHPHNPPMTKAPIARREYCDVPPVATAPSHVSTDTHGNEKEKEKGYIPRLRAPKKVRARNIGVPVASSVC
jgi:hypothetical protein